MTKRVQYRVQLKGKPELVALTTPYIQSGLSLGEYRKLRRAIEDVFGNDLRLDIISVARQTAARVKRL